MKFSLWSQSGSTEVLRPLRVWHSWSKRTAGAKSSPEKMFLHCLTVWLTEQKCALDRAGALSGQWLVTASYAHMHLLSFATTSTMQRSTERRGACTARQHPRGIHRHLCPHNHLNWACGVLFAVFILWRNHSTTKLCCKSCCQCCPAVSIFLPQRI